MSYFIKDGYVENPPRYFIDDVGQKTGVSFQQSVYDFAEWLATWLPDYHQPPRLIDIGCGWADKLEMIHERHPDWDLNGVDHGPNILHCAETFDWAEFYDIDLEMDKWTTRLPDNMAKNSIVICSDVIEHLVNPVPLVRGLKELRAASVILSTPERDIQNGYDHMGPSTNNCHVREWNAQELAAFLESEGLVVDYIGLTRGSDAGWAMGTQLVVCH